MQNFSIASFTVAIAEGILRYKYVANILQNFVAASTEKHPLLTIRVGKVADFQEYEYNVNFDELDIESFFVRNENRFFRKMISGETFLRSEFYEDENHNFEMILDFGGGVKLGSMLYYILRWACCLAFLHRQTLGFHASTIFYKDKSLLFLGKSGTGKSTHSQLWINNIGGVELLNDDAPFVQIAENKVITWGAPWSGKTPCYKNQSAQTAAFVLLEQAPYNKISKLTLYEAITVLLGSSRFYYFNDELFTDKNYEIISEILKKIPVYYLKCLPDDNAARLVFDTLKSDYVL
jgi:hypothetical protein